MVNVLKFQTFFSFCSQIKCWLSSLELGAQWLSGRVLDSRPKGRGLEPHQRHCVVVLEQDTFILALSLVLVLPRKTRPYINERLLMGRKESNQTEQTNQVWNSQNACQNSKQGRP